MQTYNPTPKDFCWSGKERAPSFLLNPIVQGLVGLFVLAILAGFLAASVANFLNA